MYIIVNAIKNIKRHIGRKVLLSVIMFSIILTAGIGIIINTTSNEVIKDYQNRFFSEVKIELDFEKLFTGGTAGSVNDIGAPITSEEYFKYADSKYIHHYDVKGRVPIESDTLVFKEVDYGDGAGNAGATGDDEGFEFSDAYIRAYTSLEQDPAFKEGSRVIQLGRTIKNNNEALVSTAFADNNNLDVGDTITVKHKGSTKEITLTIVGIYLDNSLVGKDEMYKMMNSTVENDIIVNFETLKSSVMFEESSIDMTYFLKDPKDLEAFQQEVRAKGLDADYTVSADETSYNQIVEPVKGMSKTTTLYLITILSLGGIVIVFLSFLGIRERKYEIGVLRAIGMSKTKISAGIITEAILVTVFCLALGLGLSVILAQPVADILLSKQLDIINTIPSYGGDSGIVALDDFVGPQVSALKNISVTITPKAILLISGMSIALSLLSSIASIIYITRYEPLSILSERG